MDGSSPLSPAAEMLRPLDLRELTAVSVLGRGAKGVVFHVRLNSDKDHDDQTSLALKAIARDSVTKHRNKKSSGDGGDAYRRIWFERDVLLALRHPLLPSLRGVVSTEKIVGFAIERCSGGDLSSLRMRQTEKIFSDNVILFYAAEIVLALQYLHSLGIVYRDLKPNNILIQDDGHIMLVDFDLSTKLSSPAPSTPPPPPSPPPRQQKRPESKKRAAGTSCLSSCYVGVSPEEEDDDESPLPLSESPTPVQRSSHGKSNSFVGTEDYIAPEVIAGRGHDFAVDMWGLGVVLYEMLYGRTPFRGANRKETLYRILTKDPELVGDQTPLRDLIRLLLAKDPEKRIGIDGVKRHSFFEGVKWEKVLTVARPPFIPALDDDVAQPTTELDVENTVFEMRKPSLADAVDDKDSNDNNKEHFSDF